MAVYTHVTEEALRAFLAPYDIGDLVSFDGIAEGVENTNYLLNTTTDKFILTLFEKRVAEADLPFFIDLMRHFSRGALPVPRPIADRRHNTLSSLCGRPALIITFLDGAAVMQPAPQHCAAMGAAMARLHLEADGFTQQRPNDLGLDGWKKLARATEKNADDCAKGLSALIADELDHLERQWPDNLPAGAVHADLFPDNVFFKGGDVSGVIDFYFACTDAFAYDLAVCLNAWSSNAGYWSHENAGAMLEGYQRVRPLGERELRAMPTLLRGAALRFLLTRLYDWINQVDGALVTVKDPLEFRDLLLHHRQQAARQSGDGPTDENSVIEIYTDGACAGNPGPGGWGVLILGGAELVEMSGGDAQTTNNRMELQATIEALRATKAHRSVTLYTDSQYVKKGVTEWMAGWKRNGWKTSARKPVKNRDLWETLDSECEGRQIKWRWVRGHDGDEGNERADALARQGMAPYLD